MNFFETFEELNKLYEAEDGGRALSDFLSAKTRWFTKINSAKNDIDKESMCNQYLNILNMYLDKATSFDDKAFIDQVNAEINRVKKILDPKFVAVTPEQERAQRVEREFSLIKDINDGVDSDELYYFRGRYATIVDILKDGIRFVPEDSGKKTGSVVETNSISLTTNITNVPARRVGHYKAGIILDKQKLVGEIINRQLATSHVEYFTDNTAQITAIGRNNKPYITITPDLKPEATRGNFQIHIKSSGEVAIPPIIYAIIKNDIIGNSYVSKTGPVKKREYLGKDPSNNKYPNFLRIATDLGTPIKDEQTGEKVDLMTLNTVSNDIASVIETKEGLKVDCTSKDGKKLIEKIKEYFLKQTLLNEFEYRLSSAKLQENLNITNMFKGLVVDKSVFDLFNNTTSNQEFIDKAENIITDNRELYSALQLRNICKRSNLPIKYFDLNSVVVNDEDFLNTIEADLIYDKNLVSPEDAPFDISRKIRLHEELDNSEAIIVDNEGLGAFFSSVILDDLLNEVSDIV